MRETGKSTKVGRIITLIKRRKNAETGAGRNDQTTDEINLNVVKTWACVVANKEKV